jgi:hypothetical protein
VELGPLGSLHLAAWQLSPKRTFHGRARDHREAVEFLVQYRLLNELANLGHAVPILSRVHPNPYTRLKYVTHEADRCVQCFLQWLNPTLNGD